MDNLDTHERFSCSPPPSPSYAPWYRIPHIPIVSVEHPFIIKNTEKGIASFGGPVRLKELTRKSDEATARLYIRPGDRMFKPLQSANIGTNNVLLKITVPKRTGLKRRKGLQGPFHEGLEDVLDSRLDPTLRKQVSMTEDTHYLIRSMRDNPTVYQVDAAGTIGRTHRFRGMPDFVVSTANMPFMKKMQEHILPFDYEKMKGFAFDLSKGPKPNTEIIPPPAMTTLTHPFNYSYRQNPYVKKMTDPAGNVTLTNTTGQPRILGLSISYDAPDVPNAPASQSPPVESLDPALQRLIANARRLLEERPIFTRRAFINSLPGKDWEMTGANSARHIFQYCGYSFSAGPWRDAIVRFGVDPRKDPSCRIYQTMMFMLDTRQKGSANKWVHSIPDRRNTEQVMRKESHLFDGETVSKDGKVWQACDVTDPLLKDILTTSEIRSECHIEGDGWYLNGTWSKAKMIMKAKITAILAGLPQQHAAYAKVAREMPDNFITSDKAAAILGKDATPYETQLGSAIRANAFSHGIPIIERSPSQEGDSDVEDDGGGISMPERSGDATLDPRIVEATLEIDRLNRGTAQLEGMVDEMDIDGSQDASVQEGLDQQLYQGP